MLLTLYQRACLLVMKRFDLKRFCSAIESRKISLAYIVPPIAAVLCDSAIPDNYDLSSVECMVSGAAPLSVSLIDRLHTHRGIKLIQGYGLTETSPAAFMMVRYPPELLSHRGQCSPELPKTTRGSGLNSFTLKRILTLWLTI